ncbi:unnamed protein product [Pleuronectes platessa]|uniref:Uncharacterized protein n=1 Tax=Pleuronectes platessa TaxID=8262 RepID=A0A9N7U8W8_PLEPL|nr:unnamed protein product [Pleuronectes platessa]
METEIQQPLPTRRDKTDHRALSQNIPGSQDSDGLGFSEMNIFQVSNGGALQTEDRGIWVIVPNDSYGLNMAWDGLHTRYRTCLWPSNQRPSDSQSIKSDQ